MSSKLESKYDWRDGSESPRDNRDVAFNTFSDATNRVGIFRNGMFVEPGRSGKVWGPRSIAHWVYLEPDGTMTRK